ncbi:MAG: ComEC/Rec2 family competence protein, partial [Limisphaerales bacterium]
LVTSAAAWLGSLPFAANYFHLFTPVALLANLAVVPLAGFALMSTIGSFVTAVALPPLTEIFNHAAWFFMRSMIWASERSAELPGAFFNVRSPSHFEFITYYSVVFSICTGWVFRTRCQAWVCSGLAVMVSIVGFTWITQWQSWKLTVMPLGGGDSVIVDAPGTRNDLLVDCGDAKTSAYAVRPFLQAQGFNRVRNLLLTHGDVRHVGGTMDMVTSFNVESVYTSPVSFRSSPYRSLLNELDTYPDLRTKVAEGDTVAGWTVLYPRNGDKFSQADDGPLVLKRRIHGLTFLLVSDLARSGQNLLLERHPILKADVVISGIPRDGEALSSMFIEQLQPRLIIITDTEYPATERASAKLRERLESCGTPVLFTRETGTVTFDLKARRRHIRV